MQYTTLCTLLKVLQTLAAFLQTLATAVQNFQNAAQSCDQQSPSLSHYCQLPDLTQYVFTGSYSGSDAAGQAYSEMSTSTLDQLSDNPAQQDSAILSSADLLDSIASSSASALQQQQLSDVPYMQISGNRQPASFVKQWTEFMSQLQQAFRARLPDPQALLAVLNTLQKASTASAAAASEADTTAAALQDESQPSNQTAEAAQEASQAAAEEAAGEAA